MSTLFFDLETRPIARGYAAPHPVAASWSWDGAAPELGLIADFVPVFERALADDTLLVNQNIAYDMSCMCTLRPDLIPAVFDKYARGQVQCIMLNEKILRFGIKGESDPFFSLADLCDHYGLPPVNKSNPWRLEYASLARVPVDRWPESAREYLIADADRPAKIWAKQWEMDALWKSRTGHPILHLAGEEAYKAFALNLIACKGLYTDATRTRKLKDVLERAIEVARKDLAPLGLIRPDGTRDMKRVYAFVAERARARGLEVKMTPAGKVSTAKEVLELIPDDLVTSYSIYSQASTYRARVEDMMQGFVLPLQPRIDSLKETSRTSFSKPKDGGPLLGVTAQNFPKKIMIGRGTKSVKYPTGEPQYAPVGARECLTPPPGFVFIVCDLPTAELRSVAQQCYEWFNASTLGDAINAGKDVHHILGGTMAGIPYAEMIARKKDAIIKEIRDRAKPGNFGFWGGMGPDAFMAYAWKQAHIMFTCEEAEEIRTAWRASWPEHAPYFERARYETDRGGVHRWYDKRKGEWYEMKVALVRHPATGRWRARCPYTVFNNTHFQERTATGAGRGVCEVQRECFAVPSSPLYGAYMVAFSHDELVGVAREDVAPEAADRLGVVMRDKFNELHDRCPIKEIDAAVSRVYSKGIEAIRDSAGRLVPWEYKEAA